MAVLGVIIGSVIIYLLLARKLKDVEILNEKTREQNQHIQEENQKLTKEYYDLTYANNDLINNNKDLENTKNTISLEISYLTSQKNQQIQNIQDLENQAQQAADAFYKQTMDVARNNIEQSMLQLGEDYLRSQEEYENEYKMMMAEYTRQMQAAAQTVQQEIQQAQATLADERKKVASAVEASKRAEELKNQKDFYRLQLSQIDIDEIAKLRSIIPFLRDSEPLNKVIWKVYYEKPYTDLIGRVVGNGVYSGIYKITNTNNNMCYVGQAVNIADRWKQHIKRGIGAETPTRNKLYPAMLEFGVENFTFEIIEKVERSQLNDREDYWQEYFHAKDFGYSIK